MKRLVHGGRVLVTDGGRAIVFRNIGEPTKPRLEQVKLYSHDNPPSRDLGTDKPPRLNSSSGHRSTIEPTDFHQQAEDQFIQQVALEMDKDLKANEFSSLIVAAPPVALGVYRKTASTALVNATVMEINKDLTKHSPADVAAIVIKALESE